MSRRMKRRRKRGGVLITRMPTRNRQVLTRTTVGKCVAQLSA